MSLKGILAVMLNNRAKEDAQKVLDALQIKRGDTVADIGSGGGFFTFEFASRAGENGRVYAVDTDAAFRNRIKKIAKKKNIGNIETVVGEPDGCPLPQASCDLIFLRNVFHHIKNPGDYMKSLKDRLKPGGRIAVIEWEKSPHGRFSAGHYTASADIQKIMMAAGYSHLNFHDFLKKQSFNIFGK